MVRNRIQQMLKKVIQNFIKIAIRLYIRFT